MEEKLKREVLTESTLRPLRRAYFLLYKYLFSMGVFGLEGVGEWKVEGEWEWKCEES